jgi:hypothetical protein
VIENRQLIFLLFSDSRQACGLLDIGVVIGRGWIYLGVLTIYLDSMTTQVIWALVLEEGLKLDSKQQFYLTVAFSVGPSAILNNRLNSSLSVRLAGRIET